MTITERFFTIGDQWNVIHLPTKPNGFAIFVLGDVNHYVNGKTSSWHQRQDQFEFIDRFKKLGYTIISSNLYGRNWGSEEACHLFFRLYDEVMKKEILNRKVHILAEGMGAIVCAKMVPSMEHLVRSIVMINPCLNLKHYFQMEKENKLFYKRILKELKKAYVIDKDDVLALAEKMDTSIYRPIKKPLKIIHCLHATPYSLEEHVRPYERLCNNNQETKVEVALFFENKAFTTYHQPTQDFFKKYENTL